MVSVADWGIQLHQIIPVFSDCAGNILQPGKNIIPANPLN